MKAEHLLPDEGRPAMEPDANAGQKKMKPLTAEEKQRQRDRLKDVPDDVKEEAIAYTSSFITKTMKRWGFNLQNGPFSYDEMQGDAVKVIAWDCYCAIFYGERRWPENLPLDKTMAGIARSKMDHIVSSYSVRKSHPTFSTDDDDEDKASDLEKEMEEAMGMFNIEMGMRGLGFEIAINAVGDNATYLLYLQALQEANSYDYMADKMHMTVRKVLNVEKKLLKFLNDL